MSKGLEALEIIKLALTIYSDCESDIYTRCPFECEQIEKELKEAEKKDNALKTISDIIRDFNKGEFANGECALEEITNILKEVLL